MDKQLAIDLASFRTLEKLGYKYNGGEYWKPPLGKAPDYIDKPLYTQAMSNHDIKPKVGMSVLFPDEPSQTLVECKILMYHLESVFIYIEGWDGGHVISSTTKFKPLTPPIELIDGKAYQFDIMHIKNGVIGIYSASDDEFIYLENVCRPDDCTNIQLLEVK